jgi:hypothetical protein
VSSENLLFDPRDKDDSRPLVEIIVARLGGKLRAESKAGYTLYAIEDWVYTVSGSHTKDRGEPWRELKERMEDDHAIEGSIIIDRGNFPGPKSTAVKLDACDDYGLYYIFQFIDQGVTNDVIKAVRRYLAAAGVAIDTMRLSPESAIDFGISQYQKQGKSDLWIRNRLQGKIAREQFMYALRIAISEFDDKYYGMATNRLYFGLFGRTTEVLRDQLNLKKKDSLRDNLSDITLLVIAMAETLCARDLPNDGKIDYEAAAAIVYEVAQFISQQVKLLEARDGGRDLITGDERLPDDHPYHKMIEDSRPPIIDKNGFYRRDFKRLRKSNQ